MKALFAMGLLLGTSIVAGNELPLGHKDHQPSAAQPVGWRGDGTGRFPGATPVTEWDLATGKKVAWRTELPSANSSPVVVGDKLFVTTEPNVLVCLSAVSGQVLWQATPDVFSGLGAKRAGGAELFRQCGEAQKALRAFAPNAAPKDLAAQAKHLWTKLEKNHGVRRPDEHGYANSTPLSDGLAVYVKFGTGGVPSTSSVANNSGSPRCCRRTAARRWSWRAISWWCSSSQPKPREPWRRSRSARWTASCRGRPTA